MEYIDVGPGAQQERVVANCLIESFPSGKSYTVLLSTDPRVQAQDFGPERVPDGHVFLLGDNRDRSYDSCNWGFVPMSSIGGTATVIWWSTTPSDGSINFERLGMPL